MAVGLSLGRPRYVGDGSQVSQPAARPMLVMVGVGTLFTATVISGFILGYWVDVWLATNPLFMLAFGLLGMVGGILRAYRLLTRVPK